MTETDNTRIALLEVENRHLNGTVEKLDHRLTAIEESLKKLNTNFDKVAGAYAGLFALLALFGGIGAIIGRFFFK